MKSRATMLLLGIVLLLSALPIRAQRWQKVALPAPYSSGYYLDIFFLPNDPSRGWAVDQNAGYVIRTVDGGNTWAGVKVDPALNSCHLEYVQFLDANIGYVSGPCGVYKSTDGGVTWSSIHPDQTVSLWGGWFRNANEGWFAGGGGCGNNVVFRTVDGGLTYTRFTDTTIKRSVLSDPYWDATMPANTLYAAGAATVWKSEDDGVTWQVHAYTGTNAPWHEELAMKGASICVPLGGAKCSNVPGVTTGMRFSPDNGTSWREFNSGQEMFGTFLLSPTNGWAAGWAGSVYHTTNAGINWTLRTCGLNGADLDDVFFQNDTTGWVAGEGIFRTASPLRTVSDSLLVFKGVCPDSAKRDTVRVTNVNWFSSPWTATITGADAVHFRIVNTLPASIASCGTGDVIVEYKPLTRAAHNATLVITVQQPETTLVVPLQGDQRGRTAYPVDTLVTYRERVGTQLQRSMMWRSTSATDLEAIVRIVRVSGDTNISMTATYPATVGGGVTLTYVTANLRDTGWVQTTFRVTLAPCGRDTLITVRVYGESPIFNSIAAASVDAGCDSLATLRIPIWNTGNIPLVITRIDATTMGVQPFRVKGFVSGRFGAPWSIAPGERDTLLVDYIPQSSADNVTLTIEHDDRTLARGSKTPWVVALRGTSQRTLISVTPRVIDLGSMCVGTFYDRSISVTNTGTSTAAMRFTTTSQNITGLPQSSVSLIGGQQRSFTFTYTARAKGPFTDTIAIRLSTCDAVEYVIVKGLVEDLALTITPSSVRDSADVGVPMRHRFVVRLAGGDSARIVDIRVRPLPMAMTTNIPSMPFTLRRNDSVVVTIEWSSPTPAEYRGVLEVVAVTSCSTTVSSDVYLRAMSTSVKYGPTSLAWQQQCSLRTQLDSFYVDIAGERPITIRSLTISPTTAPFQLLDQSTPRTLAPNMRTWFRVAYEPTMYDSRTASVIIVTDQQETLSVGLSGRADVASLDVQPTLIDLGELYACSPNEQRRIVVRNIGTIAADARVILIDGNNGLRVPSSSALRIVNGDSAEIVLDVEPALLPVGALRSIVRVVNSTCPDTIDVSITALRVQDGTLRATPNPVRSSIVVGANSRQRVVLANEDPSQRRVVSATIATPANGWTLAQPFVERRLPPNGTDTLDLVFTPTSVGDNNAQLVLVSESNCRDTTTIQLLGVGRDPGQPFTHTLNLHIDDYVAQPGAAVRIPVTWQTSIRDAAVDSVKIDVIFTHLNLRVDSVLRGTMRDVDVTSSSIPGRVEFVVRRTGSEAGTPGDVAVIYGTAFSAIPDSTPLSFATVSVWAGDDVIVGTDDGSLVVDACGPRFLIRVGVPAVVRVVSPTPAQDHIRIAVRLGAADAVSIEIVDLVGNVVARQDSAQLPSGESTLSLALPPALASGTYMLRVSTRMSGSTTTTIPVIR